MFSQHLGERTDRLERRSADVVFDALDVLGHVSCIDTQHVEKLSQDRVARLNPMGYRVTLARPASSS